MKSTQEFKESIENHLKKLAIKDPLFAETLKKPNKNIDDCITYIINEVLKSGQNGFADEEIFGMAIHYYDEDNIEVGNPIENVKIITNQKQETKKETQPQESIEKKESPVKKVSKIKVNNSQMDLFGGGI